MQVKELAVKLGEVELPVRPRPPQFETWKLLPEDAEAFARVALEYVEEQVQKRTDKIISGEFLPWEIGALPVPLPPYLKGIVCLICHKEVLIKLDSETGRYIATESCDCVEEPK